MTIAVTSTSKIVELNGVPARVWEGETSSGQKVHCFITRIACHKNADQTQFQKELTEVIAPSGDVAVYPLKMVI